ncbi:GNAT family N-acetyltransferase [Cyanobium sp. PCC 7001]|uniref:GNAT family N-acetyltransferase n=1 Tax=Cyanobium sp. PCC 7001 TaxID=180281 RepID=UPI0008FEFDA3
MIITPIQASERQDLLDLAVRTGLFSPSDAEGLLGGVLDTLSAQELPEGHAAVACRASTGEKALGWSYFAPDPYAEGVLNVWWIGADPPQHGRGVGSALLSHVETEASKAGARVVVIETSDQPPLTRAREFYVKRGYRERGRVPDFYAVGEAKVIFSRTLAGPD